jgi:hypothetical protein
MFRPLDLTVSLVHAIAVEAQKITCFQDTQSRYPGGHYGLGESPTDHLDTFLRQDLSVERLTNIHGWLWIVGRPQAARSLRRLKIKNRTIIATEQADLHLTWSDSYIFIKPLPPYLLYADF